MTWLAHCPGSQGLTAQTAELPPGPQPGCGEIRVLLLGAPETPILALPRDDALCLRCSIVHQSPPMLRRLPGPSMVINAFRALNESPLPKFWPQPPRLCPRAGCLPHQGKCLFCGSMTHDILPEAGPYGLQHKAHLNTHLRNQSLSWHKRHFSGCS